MKLVVFVLLAALSRPCLAAGISCPADALDKDGKGTLLLFSALPLGKTKFAKEWGKAQKELTKTFPGLVFEKPENLHVTLSFMGPGWKPAEAGEMEALALEGPDLSSGPLTMKGAPDLFGPKKQVVALALSPVPEEWASRLMKKRQAMTDKGFRKRDMYDDVFQPHVSLASAPKPDEQRDELASFKAWMSARAKRFGGLELPLTRDAKPAFFLVLGKSPATRFVPLREYCAAR
jgi:2'-5' RNA ligase